MVTRRSHKSYRPGNRTLSGLNARSAAEFMGQSGSAGKGATNTKAMESRSRSGVKSNGSRRSMTSLAPWLPHRATSCTDVRVNGCCGAAPMAAPGPSATGRDRQQPAIYGRRSTLSRRRSNVASIPKAAIHMMLRRTAKADRVRCWRLVGTFCRDLEVMKTVQFPKWLGVDLRYVVT